MSINKLLNPIYRCIYEFVTGWQARQRKKRSERALALLNDHLLNDVGLCRVEGKIVPIKKAVAIKTIVNKRQKLLARNRLRHPFLLRRREE
jgi:uncharacterized protein YjiS (DUF1127 family)